MLEQALAIAEEPLGEPLQSSFLLNSQSGERPDR